MRADVGADVAEQRGLGELAVVVAVVAGLHVRVPASGLFDG